MSIETIVHLNKSYDFDFIKGPPTLLFEVGTCMYYDLHESKCRYEHIQ